MTTIAPANFSYKDSDGDLGQVLSLTANDIALIDAALQDIENLKLAIQKPNPAGTILLSAGSTVPDGYLLCNGALISRTTYATLFTAIGTTYGAGDGSTTFALPDMRNRYPIGAGDNTLGTYLAEQLPNIIGTYQGGGQATGAFYQGTLSTTFQEGTGGIYTNNFSANRSNSIYTDNGKVYPLSLCLNYVIKC